MLRQTFGDKDHAGLHDAWHSRRQHSSTVVPQGFPSDCRALGNVACLETNSDIWAGEVSGHLPCTILANLWYLLKLSNFLSGFEGEGLKLGLPSRQKVTSVK